MSRFQYQPLNAQKSEIRLIYLLPGSAEDRISIRLIQVPFVQAKKAQYEALSYTWGSTEDAQSILVRCNSHHRSILGRLWQKKDGASSDDDWSTLQVTKNLAIALRHLRRPEKFRVLWIDAICIDQQNMQERSTEVSRMDEIYRDASRVTVWLGPKSFDSDLAMETLSLLSRHRRPLGANSGLFYILSGPNHPHPLNGDSEAEREARRAALVALLQRPWFNRLWIWQEVILATRVSVVCGFYEMPWFQFHNAIFMVMGKLDGGEPMRGCLHQNLEEHIFKLLSLRLSISTTPSALLDYIKHSLCTDPRDRIYGILSLLPKDFKLSMRPDYTKTVQQVYQEAFFTFFMLTGDLEMLTLCEMPFPQTWKCSWVPDFSNTKLTKRINYVSACGFSKGEPRHAQYADEDMLLVKGVNVDSITYVSSSIPHSASSQDVLLAIQAWMSDDTVISLGDSDEELTSLVLALICVCCNIQDADGEILLDVDERIKGFRELMAMNLEGVVILEKLIQLEFVEAVATTLLGQALFKTADGYIGVGPAGMEIGDHIGVLLGCAKPLILRPVPQAFSESIRYRVVGQCFVPRLMDKEAFLGDLPPPWKRTMLTSPNSFSFLYSRDGMATREDPRLGPLPPKWLLTEVRDSAPDGRYVTGTLFVKNGKGADKITTPFDPRLSPEALIAKGVKVETLMLI